MRRLGKAISALSCVALLGMSVLAQKVKVGYDKSMDFSRFKTYTLHDPGMPPARPVLYNLVVNSIDGELSAKGLQRIDKGGDIILELEGGIDYGIAVAPGAPLTSSYGGPPPDINSTMWTGANGGKGELMPAIPDASLQLQFIDTNANKVVWSGTVTQKLDPDDKAKSLELAQKAVTKLLKRYPPANHGSK